MEQPESVYNRSISGERSIDLHPDAVGIGI